MKKTYLSVVIPAYNEAKNIKNGSLEEVYSYMKKQKYSWEVLVADDGSTDDTLKLIEVFCKKSLRASGEAVAWQSRRVSVAHNRQRGDRFIKAGAQIRNDEFLAFRKTSTTRRS